MEFYERVSGARLHANYIRPGGVAKDVDDELLQDMANVCRKDEAIRNRAKIWRTSSSVMQSSPVVAG